MTAKRKIGTVMDGPSGWWVVLAMFGAIGLFALVMAVSASGAGRIELTAVPFRFTQVDPPGGRAGDLEWVRWSLRDRRGDTVGSGAFSCRWHRKQERLCSGEIKLPLGRLTVEGTSATRADGLWAVTGGTGRYKGAGGELAFRAISFSRLAVTISL